MSKPEKQKFTFNITKSQRLTLGRFAARKLSDSLEETPALPPKVKASPPTDELADVVVSGLLTTAHYDKLKRLAQENNLSMSKAAIRLLQLPE